MTLASQIVAAVDAANAAPHVVAALTPPLYFGYVKNAAGKFEVFEVRRIAGKLTRGAMIFAYTTQEAAHMHCWTRNTATEITR